MGVIILTTLHYVLCFGLILIVLLQAGKGGGLAAAFGGGSSETIFGTRRGNILTRTTAIGVSIFMLTSLLLTIILPKQISVIQRKGVITEDQMRNVKRPQLPGVQPTLPPTPQETSVQAPTKPAEQTPPAPEATQVQKQAPQPPPQTQQQPTQPPKTPVTQPPGERTPAPPNVEPPTQETSKSKVKEAIPLTPLSPKGDKE